MQFMHLCDLCGSPCAGLLGEVARREGGPWAWLRTQPRRGTNTSPLCWALRPHTLDPPDLLGQVPSSLVPQTLELRRRPSSLSQG